jgi:hypothetical protein
MLGFNAFSEQAISDISLPVITGVLYAIDSNDTAQLTGANLVAGSINTTDNNDTALLIGELGPEPSPTGTDTHDGFTKEEIRRARNLDRKIREKELALLKAQRANKEARKQRLRDLVDPPKVVAKRKQNKLQSIQEVKADIPSVDTTELEQSIAYLENQRSKLVRAVELRKQQAYISAQLAILEAQRTAELDDEESLLMLL